jgi:hypothetical protein
MEKMSAAPSDASAQEIIHDFHQRTRGFWSTEIKYKKVTALLISWAEDDLGVAVEVDRLQLLFKQDFNFETERYKIPSQNSAAELSSRLSTFIRTHSLGDDSLSIFYYGGHGDNRAVDAAGYPEWRALVFECTMRFVHPLMNF